MFFCSPERAVVQLETNARERGAERSPSGAAPFFAASPPRCVPLSSSFIPDCSLHFSIP